jgi:hypothetical protein
MPSRLGAFTSKSNKYSRVLDVAQSAQGLGLVLTTQISPSNSRVLHLRLGSHKERLRRAQEAVMNQQPMRVGVECLL